MWVRRSLLGEGGQTRETPAPGLVVYQPKAGFRYAMDPFFLAGWTLEGAMPTSFLDVGTGSGILALLLGSLGLAGEGIDVMAEWVALASRSAQESGLAVRFRQEDVRFRRADPVDLVLCNPPYRPLGQGPLPPDPLRAAARHELHGSLAELIPALASAGRRVALVLPASRGDEAVKLLIAAGRPLRRRARLDDALVLLEGTTGARLEEDIQLALREDGDWSPWVRACYARLGAALAPRPG